MPQTRDKDKLISQSQDFYVPYTKSTDKFLKPETLPSFPAGVRAQFSHAQFFSILWAVARQAPPSMGFSKQEYRSG